MMMMEAPSQFGDAFNWASEVPVEAEIGEHSLLWLTDVVENSLMAAGHFQEAAAPQPPEQAAQPSLQGSQHVAPAGDQAPVAAEQQQQPPRVLEAQQPTTDYSDEAGKTDAWDYNDSAAPAAAAPLTDHQQQPAAGSYEHAGAALGQPSVGTAVEQPAPRSKPKKRRSAPSSSSAVPPSHTPVSSGDAQVPVTPPTRQQQPRASSSTMSVSAGSKKRSSSSDSGKVHKPTTGTTGSAAGSSWAKANHTMAGLPTTAKKSSGRIDVRLIPQDPVTADLVKAAGYCHKLELKTPSSKCVGFFVSHLSSKWSRVPAIDRIQLRLCPAPAGGVSGTRSSPDGKVAVSGPALPVDVSLCSLSAHFDVVVNKERPILFLAYALPHPPSSTRSNRGESSAWACEDLSNLLCHSASMDDHHQDQQAPQQQQQAYALTAEDASLLRAMPDMSFSMPADSAHPPVTPAAPTFCWQSELGSLRASGSGSECKTVGGMDNMASPSKKRPFNSGYNEMAESQEQHQQQHYSYEHFQPAPSAQYQQQPASYTAPSGQDAAQQQTEGRKGSDKKKRRIAPMLVSAGVTAPSAPQQDPYKENLRQPSF